VSRRFQAKLVKSKNVHIIKTTASIPTKFCTVIKTTKCPSWLVPIHALQIQDGGRPPSCKNRKIDISQPRFNRFWRNLARWCSSTLLTVATAKILKFQKSKMAAAAIFKNLKIAVSWPRFDRFWQNWLDDAVRHSWPSRPLKIWNFKNPRWRRPPSWTIEKSPYLGRGLTDFDEMWHADAIRPSWPFRRLKFWKFNNPRWQRPPSWQI